MMKYFISIIDCEHCKLGNDEQYCNSSSYEFNPIERTIDRHIEEIMDKVEDPIKLAERLCLAELIPQTVLEDVRDSDIYKPYQRVAILFKSSIARRQISSNPNLFEKFLNILLEVMPSGIEEVLKNVRKTFILGKCIEKKLISSQRQYCHLYYMLNI